MYTSILATLVLAASALAAPTLPTCSTAKAVLTLPANQTALAKQTGPPSFALLGVGVQNYTCSADTGKYVSAGAVAELYDISCLAGTFAYPIIQSTAFKIWNLLPDKTVTSSVASRIASPLSLLSSGHHYFISTANGTTISPVWDMRTSGPKNVKGKPNAFVLAAKVASIPAPTGPSDVDWLQLKNVEGSLATTIYRTDTVSGQPPASCKPGSAAISVKYTSKYLLYGSTVV